MKILNQSIKRLALLSTAAILPMLAITSCSDDDDPPAATGNVAELTQEEIEDFLEKALEVDNSLGITTQEEFMIANATIDAGSTIVSLMEFNGQDLRFWAVSITPTNINYSGYFSVTPEITFPEDNSGIILRIQLGNVIKEDDNAEPVSMEYILHYNLIFDIDGSHRFDLDLAKSSFSVGGVGPKKFSSAEQKIVPQYLLK